MLGGAKPHVRLYGGLSAAQIRTQLQKVLASDTFARSQRLSDFLRYVVEETLRGNVGTLKEQVIGHDLYERGNDYDPNVDPVVRVDARRLRDKLREYYVEAAEDPVLITLPKGSYVPSFTANAATRRVVVPGVEPIVLPAATRFPWRKVAAACALAVTLAVAVAWQVLRTPRSATVQLRPLTSLPGIETTPSLSPDGNFVVFAWSNGAPADLYIKAVDSESLRRLTETPQAESSPAWSPDGREIAFIRHDEGVFIVSAVGGMERKVANAGTHVGWSADSRSVFVRALCPGSAVVSCIDQVRIDTLERRLIARDAGRFSVSPDGKTLAYVRRERPDVDDIYLAPISGGPAKRLTRLHSYVGGVDWAPDGRSLIYSGVATATGPRLWRLSVSGSAGAGEALTAGQGEAADLPSVARTARGETIRVAYQGEKWNVSLRLVELQPSGPTQPVGVATPLANQTVSIDCGGAFSPDGLRYVFRSFRTGQMRFWIVGRDGSGLRPFTSLNVVAGRSNAWSPDGTRIVFDWVGPDGNDDIYIGDVAGGEPVRLTTDPSVDYLASWSPDGQWIYYASDRSGSTQIWKMPVSGGSPTRVTSGFGIEPYPSPDGQFIYYVTCLPGGPCPLKRVPVDGGPETIVLDRVVVGAWSINTKGIYFLNREEGKDWLDVFDPVTSKRVRLGSLPFSSNHCRFMSVSPDGRFLIGNHVDRFEANLGLVEITP